MDNLLVGRLICGSCGSRYVCHGYYVSVRIQLELWKDLQVLSSGVSDNLSLLKDLLTIHIGHDVSRFNRRRLSVPVQRGGYLDWQSRKGLVLLLLSW